MPWGTQGINARSNSNPINIVIWPGRSIDLSHAARQQTVQSCSRQIKIGKVHHETLELRTTTIGKAMPNTEIKIADVLTGETLPIGKQGELCARGYFVMKGYDDDPEAMAKAIDQDGWLHTGDLAVMRRDGYLNVTGRAKDMIIRGGENIFPCEIENLLYTHPKIADAQVLGIPDAKLGEDIVAWVRLRTGETAEQD